MNYMTINLFSIIYCVIGIFFVILNHIHDMRTIGTFLNEHAGKTWIKLIIMDITTVAFWPLSMIAWLVLLGMVYLPFVKKVFEEIENK